MRRALLVMMMVSACRGDPRPRSSVDQVAPAAVAGSGSSEASAGTLDARPSPGAKVAAAVDAAPAAAAVVDLAALPAFGAGHDDRLSEIGRYDPATRSLDASSREGPSPSSAYAAVVEQPSSVRARYLLACTLAANGKHDDARAVLGVLLAAPRCPECVDALMNVAHDRECSFDARDVALTSQLVPSPLWVAANAVLTGIAGGDVAAMTPFLGSKPVAFTMFGDNCDGECTTQASRSRAEIIAMVRDASEHVEDGSRFSRPVRLFCGQGCCGGPNPSHTHAPIAHISELCFTPGPHPKWTSMVALQGG